MIISCACGCGETLCDTSRWGYKRRYIHNHWARIHSIFKRRKGPEHPNWKGGRSQGNPYIHVWTPQGYKVEHRLIMEKQIGRPLRRDEHVHHINGNLKDNRIENLQLLTASEHVRLSMHERYLKHSINRFCVSCKTERSCMTKSSAYKIEKWYRNWRNRKQWLCNACYIRKRRAANARAQANKAIR